MIHAPRSTFLTRPPSLMPLIVLTTLLSAPSTASGAMQCKQNVEVSIATGFCQGQTIKGSFCVDSASPTGMPNVRCPPVSAESPVLMRTPLQLCSLRLSSSPFLPNLAPLPLPIASRP